MKYKQKSKFKQVCKYSQHGSGIVDTVKTIGSASNAIDSISKVYTSQFASDIRNSIRPSDNNARPGFVGEKHQILKLANGKLGVANYSGPGTSVVKRIKRRDPPRTQTDKVAQAHDLRYTLGTGIRDADIKMISKLKLIEKLGTDSKLNTVPARLAISAKMKAEDLGLLSKNAFNEVVKLDSADRKMLREKLDELDQEGYGINTKSKYKNKPASKLRQKMLNIAAKELKPNIKKVKPNIKNHIDFKKMKTLSKAKKIDLVKKLLGDDKLRPILLQSIEDQIGQGKRSEKNKKKLSMFDGIKNIISTGADIVGIIAKVAPFLALLL